MGRFLKPENKKYIFAAVTVVSVVVFLKYILPLILPFFLAVCIIAPMYPMLQKMEKKFRIGKGVFAGCIIFLLGSLLVLAVWYLVSWLCSQVSGWSGNVDMFRECFCTFVRNCCQMAQDHLGINAVYMEQMVMDKTDYFVKNMQAQIVPKLMNRSVTYMKTVFTIGGFLVVTLIATILLAKDLEHIQEKLRKFKSYQLVEETGSEIGKQVLGYIKAQALILLAISAISIIGLSAVRIENAVMAGVFAGLLDAMPFIGTGIVLMPVAFWQLLQGKIGKALCCILIYAACAVAREFLEPKLIGKKMGIYPVLILLAIYAGIKVYGLSGVVLGPFTFILIREICRKIPGFGDNPQSDG